MSMITEQVERLREQADLLRGKHYITTYLDEAADTIEQLAAKARPKTGHWIKISPAEIYECSECGQNVMTSDICAYKFCHGCGVKMVEPQESMIKDELYDFANWVAEEIFDENWEYNKDAFAELACRKLAKLGIVRANGDEWELVEPQESEE